MLGRTKGGEITGEERKKILDYSFSCCSQTSPGAVNQKQPSLAQSHQGYIAV